MSETAKYFVPGPTWVRPEILGEMTKPMIGHRSNEFKELFRGINADLKSLFMTAQTTFVVTASGTGVMQAALENCVARRVLVTTCGAFSERWYNIGESLGYEVDRQDTPWVRPSIPMRSPIIWRDTNARTTTRSRSRTTRLPPA